ncbi:MAG TPA: hypothetical protein DCR14_18995, partial [Acidimicrobiaceae bacterium]|nr:hypothetical protein [Acidimicrobiaceae bacterium]
TDMLAERLRSLVAAGAVEQRSLRHPVPAKVYALTERGQELARIAGELAGWGMSLLPPAPADGDHTNPRWALQAMARTYAGGLADGEYRWTIDEHELTVVVAGGARRPSARLVYGPGADSAPVLDVRCDERAFFRAARRGGAGAGLHVASGDTSVVAAF